MESKAAKRLTIFISEGATWKHQPLYRAILDELNRIGIKQAAAIKAIAGFGTDRVIRTANIEVLSVNLPILVEAVDLETKIDLALQSISEMARGALIEVMPATLVGPVKDAAEQKGE